MNKTSSIHKRISLVLIIAIMIMFLNAAQIDIFASESDETASEISVNREPILIDCNYDDYWEDPGNIYISWIYDWEPGEYDILLDSYYEIPMSDNTDVIDIKMEEEDWWRIVPVKPGTANIIINNDHNGTSVTIPVTVTNKYLIGANNYSNTYISVDDWICRNNTKVKFTLKNVYKGDKIIIKIGKKTYKKTIKSNKKKLKVTQKIKKAKPGTKVTITLRGEKNKLIDTYKTKVYYAAKVKLGMTKKQCKLVPGWEHRDSTTVSGNTTIWWYDDGSYLSFYKGRLKGWHY